jgi:hypothetical protein
MHRYIEKRVSKYSMHVIGRRFRLHNNSVEICNLVVFMKQLREKFDKGCGLEISTDKDMLRISSRFVVTTSVERYAIHLFNELIGLLWHENNGKTDEKHCHETAQSRDGRNVAVAYSGNGHHQKVHPRVEVQVLLLQLQVLHDGRIEENHREH